MGKPKKEKRGQQTEESGDDDLTIDPLAVTEIPPETLADKKSTAKGKNTTKKLEDDSEESDEGHAPTTKEDAAESTTSKKPASKKKKGKKKKDDDWEDDVAAELAALSMEANVGQPTAENGVGTEDHPAVKKKVKTRGKKSKNETDEGVDDNESEIPKKLPKSKKKPIATFQMLDMLDDDNDNSGSEADDKVSEEDTPDIPVEPSKKQKKKGKEKEKKRTVEDENIDALLAEINKPAEKLSKKSKKDKKKRKDEEEMEADDVTMPGEISQQTAMEADDATMPGEIGQQMAMEVDDEAILKDKDGEMEAKAEEDVDENTVKTASQKKKEKKDRDKLKKQKTKSVKTKQPSVDEDKPAAEASIGAEAEEGGAKEEEDEKEEEIGKKKKKKGEKEEKGKKKPTKAVISAMKEALQKAKDEEERLKKEEEEKIRQEDEAILKREEQKKVEDERKERKRQKEKEKKERLRSEGKLLTEKQKQDRRRALQMLELMKQQGLEVPSKDDGPKKKPVYGDKKKKKRPQTDDGQVMHEQTPSPTEELIAKQDDVTPEEPVPSEAPSQEVETEDVEEEDDTKDAWDAESEEEKEDETAVAVEKSPSVDAEVKVSESDDEEEDEDDADEDDQEETDEDESDADEGSEEESSDESESEEELTAVDRGREKIMKRREAAEKNRSVDVLRAPVVVVLGHVDTGKTKILDKLRKTNVQDGEAGGITQQIGATNVPAEAIKEKTFMCKEFTKAELKLPGLLIIDTPGHASFSNLRTRGSSLCDVAILVVDIMHGLEPQTIESINLLKKKKTPFVVALNKVDRLYQWKTNPNNDVMNTVKKQQGHTKQEFEERTRDIVVQFAEQSLNVALFYENKNKREYISMVPTSAHTGDGMGNLVSQVCELSQNMLAKRLAYSEELQATVMEVKAIHGLGTAIDVILVNGKIHEGETIVVAGTEGPIVTQIRAVLMPEPMKELRVKNSYNHFKEVKAAQGIKVIAKDLDKALAGLPFYVAHGQDEIEYYKEDVATALKEVLGAIKLTERGVFVQASTLGSLEALLEFLKESKIPYAGINIGPVHKKDIMKASVMLEHDSQYAVILAFDVKVERESQDLADSLGVIVFTADIIYHLFDKFMAHRDELKKRRQEEFKHIAVFPCKLRILPQCIFNTRDPIVVGVSVEAGFVREGTPLCVPSKEFIDIGRISSIEINHKTTPIARKGQEVCIKIDPIGDTPKLYGRHFDHTDMLCSKISRQSIDAVKDYFREDMQKSDWQLMVQLKKMFEIL